QTQTYILRHLLFSTLSLFFFSATTTSQIYTLSLHDALPIYKHNLNFLITGAPQWHNQNFANSISNYLKYGRKYNSNWGYLNGERSEEHTSELQSRENLVCRLLLEKKKKKKKKRNKQDR